MSHRTARVYEAWGKINEAKEEDLIIQGTVKCRTKGGLIVDVFGLEAFLPGSQVDVKPIRDFDDVYVGKQMDFKVVKINQEFKNVVVSHKALDRGGTRGAEARYHKRPREGTSPRRYRQEHHVIWCLR